MTARILVVAGARPNFMKVAPVLAALTGRGVAHGLVHTGQHYDDAMSDAFFRDLAIRAPDWHLGVGSASHAVQTARVMEAFERVLVSERPEWVVVVGDVNSTLACALVAAKLPGIRIAHVEAGLRSGDWTMPEEVNRVLTDRLSHLLLTPSRDAEQNLMREGIDRSRIRFAGNVMIDTLLRLLPRARARGLPESLAPDRDRFVVATVHRPSNVDHAERLQVILRALGELAGERRVLLPLHPRTLSRIREFGLQPLLERLDVREPCGYLEMLALQDAAALVVTDSGGLQEESTVLGVPCLTLRESTERPVTVSEGTNALVPWPPTVDGIVVAAIQAMRRGRVPVGAAAPEGWDGRAGERAVDAILAS